jgi:hypothetical protein
VVLQVWSHPLEARLVSLIGILGVINAVFVFQLRHVMRMNRLDRYLEKHCNRMPSVTSRKDENCTSVVSNIKADTPMCAFDILVALVAIIVMIAIGGGMIWIGASEQPRSLDGLT